MTKRVPPYSTEVRARAVRVQYEHEVSVVTLANGCKAQVALIWDQIKTGIAGDCSHRVGKHVLTCPLESWRPSYLDFTMLVKSIVFGSSNSTQGILEYVERRLRDT